MRSNLFVMSTPNLDEHPRLNAASEPFQAHAFVAKLVVEALVGCILPRLAWIDERRINAAGAQPLKDRPRDELRAVVRTQMARCAMSADKPRQHVDHLAASHAHHFFSRSLSSRRSQDPVPPASSSAERSRPPANARAETVHTKPSFGDAFRSRRCLVPANGWFEWQRTGHGKQPYFLALVDGSPLSFSSSNPYAKIGSVSCVSETTQLMFHASTERLHLISHWPAIFHWCA